MGSMDFRAVQRQQQTLSPKLQHAVRLAHFLGEVQG
jgi:hypothetical protein